MQATNPIWAEVQQSLQKTLSKPSFETWIRPAKFNCFENGLLTLIAPNTFSSDWLRKNYCETIEKAAKEICGHDVRVVFKSAGVFAIMVGSQSGWLASPPGQEPATAI